MQGLLASSIIPIFIGLTGGGFGGLMPYDLFSRLYDLIFDFGLLRSWIGVTGTFFSGSFIDKWNYGYLWKIELIYILFYAVIGIVTALGAKLWKISSPIRFAGLIVLVMCFIVYTFGIYFWMATAMYL